MGATDVGASFAASAKGDHDRRGEERHELSFPAARMRVPIFPWRTSSLGCVLLVAACGGDHANSTAATPDGATGDAAPAVDGDAAVGTGDALAATDVDAGGASSDAGAGPAADSGMDGSGPRPVYPLKKSANGRYLIDQSGAPYLIAGDAPQSLIVNLSESDADAYFADRAAHAFNSVWINLLCNTYTAGRADGTTYDGIAPFTTPGDLSTPNDAYFARADHMIALATKYGLDVILDPAETGGWLSVLVANGTGKDRSYGQYVGKRYAGTDNIVWMSGNDFQSWRTAGDDAAASAVALGIRDVDTRHIHTVELDYQTSSSSDDPTWLPVIGLDAAYTYYPTYAQVLKSYNRANPLPVFLVEGVYEFESNAQAHQATTATLRRQEYWTLLSGATGQLYGNHYTWTFASGWKGMLDSPGALQMPYLKAVFGPRAWQDLVPDQNHSVVTAGYGTFTSSGHVDDSDYLTAARTPDGALVMAYMPTTRTITVALTKLRGPATARWYDPSRGVYAAIGGSPFTNSGTQTFTPPGANGDGDGDWLLVLEAP
jgi:hypothetical protein